MSRLDSNILPPQPAPAHRFVLVTGLSGSGKLSIMQILEDLGYETVDNPPLSLLEETVGRAAGNLALCVDARTRGFDDAAVLRALHNVHEQTGRRPELVFATANPQILQRRYTESRHRHPLATQGSIAEGIAAEEAATARLRQAADLVIDTSELTLNALRRMIEQRFGGEEGVSGQSGLLVTLISFAYPAGLPQEADLVFDARFLRNPHYDPMLRPRTGQDPEVGAYIEADPDFASFEAGLEGMLDLLLPRFLLEGKKYATVAIGCTGGRHRSVHVAERLAAHLQAGGWRVAITHRELTRAQSTQDTAAGTAVPAQEA